MEDFIEKFRDQFIDAEEITVTKETKFRDLDSYDSLTGMAVLMMIEDEYSVTIDEKTYKTLHSVEELYQFIKK